MQQPIGDRKKDMQQLLNAMLSVEVLKRKMYKEVTRLEKAQQRV